MICWLRCNIVKSAYILPFSYWFYLWYLGVWMNHSPPVWWSTWRFIFQNETWCVNLIWWKGVFYTFYTFYTCLYTFPMFCLLFSPQNILLWNSFFHTKYMVLPYFIDAASILYYCLILQSHHNIHCNVMYMIKLVIVSALWLCWFNQTTFVTHVKIQSNIYSL